MWEQTARLYGILWHRNHTYPCALAETYGEESALVWPRAVAPFDVWILPLKGCADVNALGSIVSSLEDAGLDVAIDDRNITFGSRVRDAELVGPFWIVIAGQRFAEGFVEVRCKNIV